MGEIDQLVDEQKERIESLTDSKKRIEESLEEEEKGKPELMEAELANEKQKRKEVEDKLTLALKVCIITLNHHTFLMLHFHYFSIPHQKDQEKIHTSRSC